MADLTGCLQMYVDHWSEMHCISRRPLMQRANAKTTPLWSVSRPPVQSNAQLEHRHNCLLDVQKWQVSSWEQTILRLDAFFQTNSCAFLDFHTLPMLCPEHVVKGKVTVRESICMCHRSTQINSRPAKWTGPTGLFLHGNWPDLDWFLLRVVQDNTLFCDKAYEEVPGSCFWRIMHMSKQTHT